ncbi:Ferric siderophore receptor, TonB dependent [Pseudomonas chlororaphis subsp. aurantiaca]|jgi:iron complex outermembrane receptor protein|uniref:TonB-dependent siderophore receptor n=1 Tax=Pseudomonas chlororaphis TaxID=587753 RepID=UPI000F569480|nr:TonB-dependent siderophore receptor [Pseudomonas chlororaphis]AZD38587.1 Ferric siderophore receptor, TonB dependent [Pseudomonas chlororaphis subsp. aurantiaca]AZD44928.1 Ferric siderophore receptor, TonB dependent [Pseudomonas chlororaphis subsp. aurantiaca]AZD57484.1 Ferric siderophore receptor, TonB dependent [Pseudomonas chlororaphis subsp. aurantiaca]AZD63420.1 Ferric siderophore receptor, TonB dependent [Pseudomonas chlororaphis subsp. aurantiaca]UVE45206.1 TonB-dependent siderophore
MSRSLDTLLRPSLLAVAIALCAPLASTPLIAAEQASGVRAYNLPAAPLASTLNQIASQAGLALSLNPSLAAGKTSAPVKGQFDAAGALREALRGTGLQLEQSSAGTYSLVAIPDGVVALPETSITGQQAYESAWGPVDGYLATRTAAGTKTDTSLVEAPRSISVATRQQMEDRNVQNLDDAVRYMPGIVSASYGSDTRYDWMRVRGFEPTQFLDGLPLPRGVYANPKAETWNLDRLALLRGPASSVYGQTPPGGLLDMVSRRPSAESSHAIQLQYGSDNYRQINFASTGKIDDEGQFLYGLSGVVRDAGTQVDHIDNKRYNIAPSLTWNIDTDTRLTLLSQFTRDDTGATSQFMPIQGTKIKSPLGDVSHHKNLGDPDYEFYDRTYYALGYAFEHRFNDVWQFRQNLRYTKSELSFQQLTVGSYAYSPADAAGNISRTSTNVDEDISQFAVDNNFQADFATGDITHTLLIGLDHQRTDTSYLSIYGDGGTTNIFNPVYGKPIVRPARSSAYYDYNQKTVQTGLYVQDQMALDQWRLTLGGREDWVHQGTTYFNKNDVTNTDRSKNFSGNAALSYVFDSGLVPYLSYAESFQPASNASVSPTESYKPTEGKQWELGIKYQPPGSNTLLSAAVYDLTQKNVLVTSIGAGGESVTNQTGEVKVKGLELEAVSDVTDNLKVIAAYTLAKSEVQKGIYKGNRLQLMPNQQASLWTDYTWHSGVLDGFGIGAGARYTGNTYGDQANTWLGKANAYTVFDAAVHYDLGRLDSSLKGASLKLNATNLFDKDYLSTCDGSYCYFGDQRSVVASATYQW